MARNLGLVVRKLFNLGSEWRDRALTRAVMKGRALYFDEWVRHWRPTGMSNLSLHLSPANMNQRCWTKQSVLLVGYNCHTTDSLLSDLFAKYSLGAMGRNISARLPSRRIKPLFQHMRDET